MTDDTLPELGHYTHSKSGKAYQLLYRAKHSETLEPLCVYTALYGEGQTWVRPLNMWNELVEVNGEMVPRFKKTRNKRTIHKD